MQEDQSLRYFMFYCSFLTAAIRHMNQIIYKEPFLVYVVEDTPIASLARCRWCCPAVQGTAQALLGGEGSTDPFLLGALPRCAWCQTFCRAIAAAMLCRCFYASRIRTVKPGIAFCQDAQQFSKKNINTNLKSICTVSPKSEKS